MKIVNLKSWFLEQFKIWKKDESKTLADFAAFLDVPPTSLSNWMNAGMKMRADNIQKIADKLGPEIYDVLGLRRPDMPLGITVPLVGRVRAGEPIPLPPSDFASFDPESTVQVLRSWLPKTIDTSELFALEVEGDSMIDMGIESGSTIILKRQPTAEPGDIVVAALDSDESTTLKRFYRDNGSIRLQPENKRYKAITLPAKQVRIIGKLVLLIRPYK